MKYLPNTSALTPSYLNSVLANYFIDIVYIYDLNYIQGEYGAEEYNLH